MTPEHRAIIEGIRASAAAVRRAPRPPSGRARPRARGADREHSQRQGLRSGVADPLPARHRRVLLAARPVGAPRESDFRLVEAPVPDSGGGEFLVRGIYLSLDPYMRGRMSAARSYAPPVGLGEVMEGGVVGEVVRSQHARFAVGDVVEGRFGWQEYAVSSGSGVRKVDPTVAPISTALGVLGMPGLTAYFGLLDVAQARPGDTVVVSAAAGAVGSVVGQIAKLMGCRAVGLAGSPAKIDYLVRELGYDAGIDYRAE